MKDGKAVNYNCSEIIGLINLKYGKRTACRDNFFYRECGIFLRSREKVNNGIKITVAKRYFGTINLTAGMISL